MVVKTVSRALTRVFGSRNERLLKGYRRRVEQINALEPEVRKLTDPQLRAKTQEFRDRIAGGESVRNIMPEVMAVAREAMDRSVGIRNALNPEAGFDATRLPQAMQALYAELRQQADQLEPLPVLGGAPAPGWMQVEIPNELYDAVRELYPQSRPPFRARPFDVQLIGGMVLGEGKIAEMKTGEGKTIVAPLACYVACIESLQCHVVTVNDYLVQRDRDWVFPFYYHLGLTVGAIHPIHQQPPQGKAQAYECDVLYGTNSELGFDYLRDNMKLSTQEQVQKRRDFCIVDEIDSILIDEARTPLIISGPAHSDAPRYDLADQIARHLVQKQREWDAADAKVKRTEMLIKGLEGDIRNARDKGKIPAMREEMKKLQQQLPQLEAERDRFPQFYEVELDKKQAHLTHDGVAEAQKQAGIGSFYVGNNMDFPHLLENAVRAHVVYKRDKDYVVRDGEVIIVDTFTGRLMIGRQWSDGLHQAVEAKENVKIKEETQTLATVTIQNFFKLYKRLAGMTGTAVTEATEFDEIYELDVVCIPTNRPIARIDRNDLIFLSEKDKKNAIVDEIKRMHDVGRPVLVGTTSVDKSEELSQMLSKRYGIQHQVLNAKVDQAEREGNIVAHAGQLGAVMIATNMAGRGTDIKLTRIDREVLVRHWQVRDLLPKHAKAQMSDEELINLSYRHLAQRELGTRPKEIETLSDDEVRLRLLRNWCVKDAMIDEKKADRMTLEQCLAELDRVPDYMRHRLRVWTHIEEMGGLHIIGTERHESRRIDNQLRGRAGRQGDNGSSRFFISMEDDLMKMFAGNATLTMLSKLGMKEGDAIEHPWVTRSVERAQRKVEERNYEMRKHVLEYDEVMEYQRGEFYGIRQAVLEGRDIEPLIFDYIRESVEDAVEQYLAGDYTRNQVAEWARQTLEVSIDPARLFLDDADALDHTIRQAARSEVAQVIDVTLGEYMSNDIPAEEWDLKGLQGWAMSRFGVDLKMSRLREMNVHDVQDELVAAAHEQIDRKDLSGVSRYLEPNYAQKQFGEWANNKFGIELDAAEVAEMEPADVVDHVLDQARQRYLQREIHYPVEFNMELVMQAAQQDQQWATNHLITFANQRYDLGWTPEHLAGKNGQDLFRELAEPARRWLEPDGRLEELVDEKLRETGGDTPKLAQWMKERFQVELTPGEINGAEDQRDLLLARARGFLRQEVTQLERFVLLQILDQAWKDHLYAMDQLKDSVGLRGYAEKDPRIEYKREGARQFGEMQQTARDRVTDLVFRARLTPNVQIRSAYGDQQTAQHPSPAPSAAVQAAAEGTAVQREDLRAAEQAGGAANRKMTRRQRRAAASRERHDDSGGGSHKQRKRKSR